MAPPLAKKTRKSEPGEVHHVTRLATNTIERRSFKKATTSRPRSRGRELREVRELRSREVGEPVAQPEFVQASSTPATLQIEDCLVYKVAIAVVHKVERHPDKDFDLIAREVVARQGCANLLSDADFNSVKDAASLFFACMRLHCRRISQPLTPEERITLASVNWDDARVEGESDPGSLQEKVELLFRLHEHGSTKERHCHHCSSSFTAHSSLMSHLRSEAGIRDFRCACCSLSFTRKCSLIYHIMVHACVPRYICPTCGSRHNHKKHYQDHLIKCAYEQEWKNRDLVCEAYTKELLENSMPVTALNYLAMMGDCLWKARDYDHM